MKLSFFILLCCQKNTNNWLKFLMWGRTQRRFLADSWIVQKSRCGIDLRSWGRLKVLKRNTWTQLAHSIDPVLLIGRAEPRPMYSLNNLLSNRAAEEANKVPQAREHRETRHGNFLMNRDGRKERTARDLISARKRRGKKRRRRNGEKQQKWKQTGDIKWAVLARKNWSALLLREYSFKGPRG